MKSEKLSGLKECFHAKMTAPSSQNAQGGEVIQSAFKPSFPPFVDVEHTPRWLIYERIRQKVFISQECQF